MLVCCKVCLIRDEIVVVDSKRLCASLGLLPTACLHERRTREDVEDSLSFSTTQKWKKKFSLVSKNLVVSIEQSYNTTKESFKDIYHSSSQAIPLALLQTP